MLLDLDAKSLYETESIFLGRIYRIHLICLEIMPFKVLGTMTVDICPCPLIVYSLTSFVEKRRILFKFPRWEERDKKADRNFNHRHTLNVLRINIFAQHRN